MATTRLRIAKQLETGTQGQILYRDSNGELVNLNIGTAGQVLKVNVGATAPEWAGDAAGSFTLTGDTGSQTIGNGDTLNVVGGAGITTAVTATDTLTLNIDNTVLTTSSSIDDLADVVITTPATGAALIYNGTNWIDTPLAPAATATEQRDDFDSTTGTGLVLTQTPVAGALVLVFKNGQLLRSGGGNDYTLAGTALTLAVALVSTDVVSVVYKY